MGVSYEHLDKIMTERGLRPADIVKGAGISSASLADWKAGRYTPKVEKRQKIADFLGVSLYYLDTGNDEKEVQQAVEARWNEIEEIDHIMQTIKKRPDLRMLITAAEPLPPDTVLLAIQLLQKMQPAPTAPTIAK